MDSAGIRRRGPLRKVVQFVRRRWRRWRADVHIISFPKCGRTWLVLLVATVLQEHYGIRTRKPLRLRGYAWRRREIPYMLQHHDGGPEFLRPDELPVDKGFYAGKRVVFLVRDPRDVLVSTYFQKSRRNYNFTGTLAEYVRHPVGGIETIVRFYNIWAANRDVPRDFLLMTYEDLHRDTAGELRRLIEFLGIAGVDPATVDRAVEFCRFDNMRRLEAGNELGSPALAARDASDEETFKTRKGQVGGYTEYLTREDIAYIDDIIETRLDPLYAEYRRAAGTAAS